MFESMISIEKTINILDEYLKSGEKFFHIKDNFRFSYNQICYSVNFIISAQSTQENIFYSNITMSDFKKIYKIRFQEISKLVKCLDHNSNINLKNIPKISLPVFDFICIFKNFFLENIPYNEIDTIIKFPFNIVINAQSSVDSYYGYGEPIFHNRLYYKW